MSIHNDDIDSQAAAQSRVRLAVLGSPISHSRSPQLHRTCYALLGREDLDYTAHEVAGDELPDFWSQLDDTWLGLSLTMPLKTLVRPYLAAVDSYAARTGVVNTVSFTSDGPVGFNTDVVGLMEVLREALASADGQSPRVASAVVFGAGATAASALCALADIGCTDVTVVARRTQAVEVLQQMFPELRLSSLPLPGQDPDDSAAEFQRLGQHPVDIAINTLPADAAQPEFLDAVTDLARQCGTSVPMVDVLYDPSPPPVLQAWRVGGGRGVDGLSLLREQGIAQALLFTGQAVDAAMLGILRSAVDEAIGTLG